MNQPPEHSELSTGSSLKDVRVELGQGLVVSNLNEVFKLSVFMIQASLVPSSYRDQSGKIDPNKVSLAILKGLELGLKPLQAVQKMYVVNGSPVVWGDAVIGLILSTGQLEDISEVYTGEADTLEAQCSLKRKGVASPVTKTFSVQEAKDAGLMGKGTWKQYTKDLLMYKARSRAARTLFADVLSGMYVEGDLEAVEVEVIDKNASDELVDRLAK